MTGQEFQRLVAEQCERYREAGRADIGLYGTQSVRTGRGVQEMRSLPDFEGVLAPHGRQIVFDAKVCGEATMRLSRYRKGGERHRQLAHMLRRAAYGAECCFLIHWWSAGPLSATQRVRVWPGEFWTAVETGEIRSLRRGDATLGPLVPWTAPGSARKRLPDFLDPDFGPDFGPDFD